MVSDPIFSQQVDSLPDASQQALVLVIDGMVKQAQMEKVVGKQSAKRQQRG